jgi:hypothetical protein
VADLYRLQSCPCFCSLFTYEYHHKQHNKQSNSPCNLFTLAAHFLSFLEFSLTTGATPVFSSACTRCDILARLRHSVKIGLARYPATTCTRQHAYPSIACLCARLKKCFVACSLAATSFITILCISRSFWNMRIIPCKNACENAV